MLPWEQDTLITVFLEDIELLEGDLRARKLDRQLTTKDSKGNAHIAFEYLAHHEQRLKASTLELEDKQTGQGLVRVQLADSSALRASRGRANFTGPVAEFNSALDDLADLAHDMHEKINARLMNTDAEERWVKRMEAALDLRGHGVSYKCHSPSSHRLGHTGCSTAHLHHHHWPHRWGSH